MPTSLAPTPRQRLVATALRGFHRYANWLVGISWKRFVLLALLLMVMASVLEKIPPFRWTWTEVLQDARPVSRSADDLPRPPRTPAVPKSARANRDDDEGMTISIDRNGVRIATPPGRGSSSTGTAREATSVASAASAASSASAAAADPDAIRIELPGATRETIREVARAAREAAHEAAVEAREEARQAVEEARQEADEARRDAEEAASDARQVRRTRTVRLGDFITDLAFLWIVASAIVKATYKGRVQAEVAAAAATETAESEQLKRQVVEARLAAMQAQIEPHFLFNTLASIDHLIETDPTRASRMQKNLIALLRASMPDLRESQSRTRTLGQEMAVVRPYLEILQVRMEDRLQARIDVPDGLLSAEFPPLMIQPLVENAIQHGLEPKAEGGTLRVAAEIVHGRLAVTVADTGLGFGRGATAGSGVGLENLRERLKLLYGDAGTMTVAENPPGGTLVTLTVPYLHHTAPASDPPAAPAPSGTAA